MNCNFCKRKQSVHEDARRVVVDVVVIVAVLVATDSDVVACVAKSWNTRCCEKQFRRLEAFSCRRGTAKRERDMTRLQMVTKPQLTENVH
mmetsp:Transcript_87754/g.155308  ORF Transcript_87754/g.155308 Transcript_87754/m.155308 type:complete len:90 (+) Transcript_87754:101-370(+)